MRLIQGFGQPGDSDLPTGDGHDYATWDAAYVLGSLSPADRREYEAHLSVCPSCRQAVAELSGMPALLSKLDSDTVAAINEGDHAIAASAMAPNMLPSLLSTVRRRRHRTRLMTWSSGAAAAVLLAIGVFVSIPGLTGHSPTPARPQASVSALPMDQVGTTLLASTVSLSSQQGGTNIALKFVCVAPVYAHHDTVALVVVGRDGSRTQLATWVAIPGHTATPAGSVSIREDQIASVQVVLAENGADNGKVMLERSV